MILKTFENLTLIILVGVFIYTNLIEVTIYRGLLLSITFASTSSSRY